MWDVAGVVRLHKRGQGHGAGAAWGRAHARLRAGRRRGLNWAGLGRRLDWAQP